MGYVILILKVVPEGTRHVLIVVAREHRKKIDDQQYPPPWRRAESMIFSVSTQVFEDSDTTRCGALPEHNEASVHVSEHRFHLR